MATFLLSMTERKKKEKKCVKKKHLPQIWQQSYPTFKPLPTKAKKREEELEITASPAEKETTTTTTKKRNRSLATPTSSLLLLKLPQRCRTWHNGSLHNRGSQQVEERCHVPKAPFLFHFPYLNVLHNWNWDSLFPRRTPRRSVLFASAVHMNKMKRVQPKPFLRELRQTSSFRLSSSGAVLPLLMSPWREWY